MSSKSNDSKTGLGLTGLVTLPIAVAGGWLAYSTLAIKHRLPLPDAILAERKPYLSKHAGWLSYYADRSAAGRPLVLIHSVNAAASAYEMGPLFRHYRGQRPVFALDLPGYGFSNRMKRAYSSRSLRRYDRRVPGDPSRRAGRRGGPFAELRVHRPGGCGAAGAFPLPRLYIAQRPGRGGWAGVHSKQGRAAWPAACTARWPFRCGDDPSTT